MNLSDGHQFSAVVKEISTKHPESTLQQVLRDPSKSSDLKEMMKSIIRNAGSYKVRADNGGYKLPSEADILNPQGPPILIVFEYTPIKRAVRPKNESLFDAAYETLFGALPAPA